VASSFSWKAVAAARSEFRAFFRLADAPADLPTRRPADSG
jgi:hypothetical protein